MIARTISLSLFLHALLLLSLSFLANIHPRFDSVEVDIKTASANPKGSSSGSIKKTSLEKAQKKIPVESENPSPAKAQMQGSENSASVSGTKGAQLIFSPLPKLPDRYASENLHASVLIEFTVYADASDKVRLVNSCGNEELDAIALDAAKRWKFLPATTGSKAEDSTIRLRVNFIVN